MRPSGRMPTMAAGGRLRRAESEITRATAKGSPYRCATRPAIWDSMSTATAVVAPAEVIGNAGGPDAGPDTGAGAGPEAFSDDAFSDAADTAGERELVVERDELPDDDVSLFGGVYDDDADEIGSLTPGKSADLITVSFESFLTRPLFDPISHLVWVADREQVCDVWIAGVAKKRDHALLLQKSNTQLAVFAEKWRKYRKQSGPCLS